MRAMILPTLLLLCATARAATPLPDAPALSIAPCYVQVTAIFEDDGTFVKPSHGADRHYTAGESLTAAAQLPLARQLGGMLPSFQNEFDAADTARTTYALGITGAQQMFTPEDISATAPIPSDHPYAGIIYGGLLLQRATGGPESRMAAFEHLELDLGFVGPAAQGRQTQQYVHHEFNATTPNGWNNQIHDEFGFNFKYTRKWRFDLLPTSTGLGLQVIPQFGPTLGTFDRNLAGSATLRFGFNLPDDFGPARIADLPSATARTFHNLGIYGFVSAGGRLVEHSTTMQGNNFRDYPLGVDPHPAVGELRTGFAIQLLKHLDFGWNWTFSTKEFEGQAAADSYGTMNLSTGWQF